MIVGFESINRILVAKINGDIDHHSCEEIRMKIDKELLNKNPKHLIIDMENVGFMDSSGIGVVIGRYKQLAASGGSTMMVNVKPQVKRICEICGLQKIIPVYGSKKQAIESIKE